MFGEKPKIKKPKSVNQRNLLGLVLAVIAAVCVFVGLTSYQTQLLSDYEKVSRVVAVKRVPGGTLITASNVNAYFTVEEIEARHDVESPAEKLEDITGYVSKTEIAKGQTVSHINFVEKEHLLAGVSDIVYVSFTVYKAGDALGGTIREGNVIDVSVATTDETIIAGKSLYVNAVYDSAYQKLSASDAAPATTIEVGMSAEDAGQFIDAIGRGNVYVSRRSM